VSQRDSHSLLARVFLTEGGRNVSFTFALVSTLFLLWGFCNGLIDVMDKHFQDELHLTKAQSAWVQTAHYLGYALMALPAGFLARSIGYRGGIITGLLLVAAGGFWFIAATGIASFWAFLLGVCIIAAGLTVLETVANPYTTVLGPKRYAALRINLAQSFNGVGWILGPIVGGTFFYSSEGVEAAQGQLYIPYAAIAIVVLVLAGIFCAADVPDLQPGDAQGSRPATRPSAGRSIWAQPHFAAGVLAQFLYVAAQAGIFSFFINFMVSEVPALPHSLSDTWLLREGTTRHGEALFLNEQGAARLQGLLAFGLFLLGRLTGTGLLRNSSAHALLGSFSLINVGLCALVVMRLGWISVAAVFLSFYFMSISFPTIFALGIADLGAQVKQGSAFLVMAILGGAILPKLMGYLGDVYNMSIAFLMPLGCFAVISAYGYAWPRLRRFNRVDALGVA
jgi:FHS family L-fucose permease-like MFS transporter